MVGEGIELPVVHAEAPISVLLFHKNDEHRSKARAFPYDITVQHVLEKSPQLRVEAWRYQPGVRPAGMCRACEDQVEDRTSLSEILVPC